MENHPKMLKTADIIRMVKKSKQATHRVSAHNPKKHDDIEFLCIHCSHIIAASKNNKGELAKCCHCDAYVIIPQNEFVPNIIIDDFVIIRLLGAGTTGTVYRAYQISLDRSCVLKVLYNKTDKRSSILKKEAQIMAKLIHNNIIQCYATGKYNDFTYYAMEYVRGQNLETLLYEQPILHYSQALNIIIQITEALSFAWEHEKIVHHDITPRNIMIAKNGEAKINDFNLSKIATNSPQHENSEANARSHFSEFVCPERILGIDVDYRGDMYSLGVVFYLMVTGHMPHSAKDRINLLKKNLNDLPIPPKLYNPDLPKDFIKIISKLLAKFPRDRYDDYEQMLEALMVLEAKYNIKNQQQTTVLTKKLARAYLNTPSISNEIPTEIDLDFQLPQTIKLQKKQAKVILSIIIIVATLFIILALLYFYYANQ
jgi:serine/threonine protein kinase